MPVLEAKDLQKQYKLGQHIVDALAGVNIQIEKGEFVAIMGPSGSGKSTLLHLLGGLDSPTEGDITLAENSLAKLSEYKATLVRRHNVGFVFQFLIYYLLSRQRKTFSYLSSSMGKTLASMKNN